jgi:threonine synthase
LPQALYYLWAVSLLRKERQSERLKELICVPSGNLGNLTGGVFASLMGLDVPRFIVAHNANNFFPAYLEGARAAFDFHATKATLSNAMDVGAPSNFERLHALVAEDKLRSWFWGCSVDDEQTLQRMRRVYDASGYIACPHTAVGLEAIERYRQATGDRSAVITLATAHPAKFPGAIAEALGLDAPKAAGLETLWALPTEVVPLRPELTSLCRVLTSQGTHGLA